jgi:hypothetical protein
VAVAEGPAVAGDGVATGEDEDGVAGGLDGDAEPTEQPPTSTVPKSAIQAAVADLRNMLIP